MESDIEVKHKPFHFGVIISAAAVMIVMFVFNAFSGDVFGTMDADNSTNSMFTQTVANVSDRLYLEITPAGWTFSIWGFIYTYQVIFMAYALSTLCRKTVGGGYLYYSVDNLPIEFFFIYMLNNLLNITWLVLYGRDMIVASAAVLALIAFTLIVCLAVSFINLESNMELMRSLNLMKDVWMIRFMVHNALAMYCTWCCIATLLNSAQALAYSNGGLVSQENASTFVLGALTLEVIIWAILDILVIYSYTNFTFTPYIVVIVALSGVIDDNFVPWTTNSTFSVILMGIAVTVFIIKFFTMLVRGLRNKM